MKYSCYFLKPLLREKEIYDSLSLPLYSTEFCSGKEKKIKSYLRIFFRIFWTSEFNNFLYYSVII